MTKHFSKLPLLHNLTPLCICLLAGMFSCKKDNQQTPPVVISSISPSSGPYSTVVKITGTGFTTDAAGDTVKFNGTIAVVQQASATELTVVVPKGAGTGSVTVNTKSMSGLGPVFTYQFTYTVSTLAGSGTAGFVNGNNSGAQFNGPAGLATDAQNNIYVADAGNNCIRKITAAGTVTTLAGSGIAGFADGTGNTALFDGPIGLATDAQGNVYVADANNNCIRKITPAGFVSTLAGSGTAGFADGTGTAALFNGPAGLATDAQDNIYVSDANNSRIRKITTGGVVSSFASLGQSTAPFGLALDAEGNIYIGVIGGTPVILKMTAAGVVSNLAGGAQQGFADGTGTAAEFSGSAGVALDNQNNIYVADVQNQRIRFITPAGVVTTIAGSGSEADPGNVAGGFADGNGNIALFNSPYGVATGAHGNIYVADQNNNRIRMITVE